MANSGRLQLNTGVLDPLLFSHDVATSYFWYHGYSTIKNFFLARKDIGPLTEPTFGGTTIFDISKDADTIGPMQLITTISALGSTGPYPDHQPRWDNFLGFSLWESITMHYGSNDIYILRSEDIFHKYRTHFGIEHRDAIAEITASDKSPTEREALALAEQTLIIDLPFPHTRALTRWIKLMQLAQLPRITVKWRSLPDLVQLGGGTAPVASFVASQTKLRVTSVFFDGNERDAVTSATQSGDGIIQLYDQFIQENFTIPVGTVGEYRVKLNNFRSSTKQFSFMLRNTTDLTMANEVNRFGNLQPVTSWRLEGSDGNLVNPIEDRYNRFYLHPLYHEGPAGEYIYSHSHALAPDDMLNSTGSSNYGNLNNLTLVVNFAVATAAEITGTAMGNVFNAIQHQNGDWQPLFR